MPDPRAAGLDPTHILAICNRATGGRRGLAIQVPDGICVCLPSRRAAHLADVAMTRVGYRTRLSPEGRGRNLLVTGWSAAGLDIRLNAMRTVLYQLASDPATTATTAVERFTAASETMPARTATFQALVQTQARLHGWVSVHSGIHVPHNPAVQPQDVSLALRLRATWDLERAIDGLAERHLRVAAHALRLFSRLRPRMAEDQAQQTAVRWAAATSHLHEAGAPGSAVVIPGLPRASERGSPPSSGSAPEASRGAAVDFPTPITPTLATTHMMPGHPARPADRNSPGRRPGPTRR